MIATQNPVEQAGTFELPEAQLDRFMLCHRLDYPSADEEASIIQQSLELGLAKKDGGAMPKTAFDLIEGDASVGKDELVHAMEVVQGVHVSPVFVQHAMELVRRTREHPMVELGASPRAGIALVQAARALAFVRGREYAVPRRPAALATDVLVHRMRLSYEALAEGLRGSDVLEEILTAMS